MPLFPLFTQGQIHHVILDAGHGGKDPGAVALELGEKDVALLSRCASNSYKSNSLKLTFPTQEKKMFLLSYINAKIANKKRAIYLSAFMPMP